MPKLLALAAALAIASACSTGPRPGNDVVKPVYNKDTGRLEQLTADRNHDGKIDTWAYMDGAHLKYIELDRNGDGVPDRWEYYTPAAPGAGGPGAGGAFDKATRLERAEEANGPNRTITRREYYVDGVIVRVEEDTDFDGRMDKWEQYEHGALVRMELDLAGRGKPDRRLVYSPQGGLDHIEVDPSGTGAWTRLTSDGDAHGAAGAKHASGGGRP